MSCNLDIEKTLLGSMILEKTYVSEIISTIGNTEPFTDERNALIYSQMKQMYHAGDEIDLVSLVVRPLLKEHRVYIAGLTSCATTGVNSVQHARLLCESYMRRKLECMGAELVGRATTADDVGDVLKWAQSSLDDTLGVVTSHRAPQHISAVMKQTLSDIEERVRAFRSGEPTGVLSGIASLDHTIGGFRGGQLIVLAGRPAMGKSAVMLHMARQAAMAGTPTVIFSLEMQGRELGDRLLLSGLDVDSGCYKSGDISSDVWYGIERGNTSLSGLPLHIADTSSVSIQSIKAQCQLLKNKGKCGLVIIDYLQLLDTRTDNRSANREREISEATRQAKIMATELDIPVILLSQLSRKVEERADKIPLLSDLRESGAIEQDADVVIFISRPAVYNIESINTRQYGVVPTDNMGILRVAKQRNGRCGSCYFRHSPDLNRIYDF